MALVAFPVVRARYMRSNDCFSRTKYASPFAFRRRYPAVLPVKERNGFFLAVSHANYGRGKRKRWLIDEQNGSRG